MGLVIFHYEYITTMERACQTFLAPVAGLEPTTIRLTVGRSTIELHRNNINLDRKCQVLSGFLQLLESQVKEK